MFLPIGDENPRETTPYVNYALLGLNVVAFLFLCFPTPGPVTLAHWAMVPRQIRFGDPGTWTTLFTSMFLHANILHLAGNMLFLWIFGDNVEDKLGHVVYLLFYLLCGVGADALHILSQANSVVPTLGASGAISGVIGAYVLFFPKARVKMLLWFYFFVQVFFLPAWMWIGIWFLEQALMAALLAGKGGGGVAYFAHIGGFLAGVLVGGIAKFVIAPGRFKQSYAQAVPAEIGTASRWADRPRGAFEPLLAIEEDEGIRYVDEPSERFAVLRVGEDLPPAGRVAAIVSGVTGEPAGSVARRLEATRGMIVRNLDRVTAERVQIELRKSGITTLLAPYDAGHMPPRPVEADRVVWDDRRISFSAADQVYPVPWMTPFLYLGAVVCREPLVDIYVTARHAFRVTSRAALQFVDPLERREERRTLREFAQSIVELHRSAAINDGIRVLSNRGSWAWLAFRDPEDFEDYAFWLYTILLSQRPTFRYR